MSVVSSQRSFVARVGATPAMLCLGLLLVLASGCACKSYKVELIPEEGMNGGREDSVRVDLVWTTEKNVAELSETKASAWFGERMFKDAKFDDLVVTASVAPEDGKLAFAGGDAKIPEGYGSDVTGFVIFAYYDDPPEKDSDHRIVVDRMSPKYNKFCHMIVTLKPKTISLETGKGKLWGIFP